MSEDASVNTGAVVWPDADSAAITVRRMQTKLHRWATEQPGRRFDDLFNLVHDPAFLVCAWERVTTNKGARTPGIDKVSVGLVETWVGAGAFLGQIRDALKSSAFCPVAVRRVMIPKGTTARFRKLGIPTIADRVVQASLKLVLEPIFEADFKACSYGFRPNRRAQDAVAEIHYYASKPRSYHWVLEADIEACFDEISHRALMDRLRARITDKRVCALVKAFLKSGVLSELGKKEETLTGTPQGGILSPLLANIALSVLDDHFDRQWREMGGKYQRAKRKAAGHGVCRLIRYADDFVLMVSGDRHHAEALREEVAAVLAPLGLRLSPDKTRVVHIDEGFDFLGFTLRRQWNRGTRKYCVYTRPSKKAVQSVKDKVKIRTYRSTRYQDLDVVLRSVNRVLVGWANYFRYAVAKVVFSAIDNHAWARLMRWVRAKYGGQHRIGMPELRRRFCDKGGAVRLQRGRVHRRIQRRGDPLPLSRQRHPDSVDSQTGSRRERLTIG